MENDEFSEALGIAPDAEIGGHHRHMACQALGYEAIPAIVLTDEKWQNEEEQKLETVRLNVIKGELDSERFMALYQEVAEQHGEDAVGDLMGFSDEAAFKKMVGDTTRAMRDAGLPDDAVNELEDIFGDDSDEDRTMENLTAILQRIFKKYGDTLSQHFMYFDWGGKQHLYVECSVKSFKAVERMMDAVRSSGVNASDFFLRMSNRYEGILAEVVEDGASKG